MAIEDEIGNLVNSIMPISNTELSNAEGWIYLFTFIGLLSVGVFLGVRYILTLQERPSGIYAGEYQFQIANLNDSGANTITAHISKAREQLTPKMATDLGRIINSERQMDIQALDEFKRLISKCVIFNANVSDFKKDNIIKGNKKAIIISNVDLSKEEYYREEAEGSFTLTTASFHKYTRNVQCISGQVIDLGTPRGEIVDVYLVNVISNNLKESHGVVSTNNHFTLSVQVFPEGLDVEILGRLVMFLPTLVELYNKVQPSEDEINRLRDKNQELMQEKGQILRQLEIAKDRAIRKPILGHDRPFQTPSKGVAWGWQIITGVMGVLGYYLPTAFEPLSRVPEWLMAILLIGSMAILRWTMENKKDPNEKTNESDEKEV